MPCCMQVLFAVHVCHALLLLTGNHACVGLVSSACMSCIIVVDWQPCFVWVLLAVHVCHVVLLLSGNHVLCGFCQKSMYVM